MGTGGIWGGVHAKEYGFKGGAGKILGVKGGGAPKRILSSFVVMTSVTTGNLTMASKKSPKK